MSEIVSFPTPKIFVRVPVPPSANSMWRSVNGRNILSKKYRQWRNDALMCIAAMAGGIRPMQGPISVDLAIKRPRKDADLDNRLKPAIDCLQAGALIEDDKQIQQLSARWDDAADGCEITIQPYNR